MTDTTFIAYAHEPESRRAATQLANQLRRDGVEVWIDQWDLKPGQEWQPAIRAALEEADTVLAVVGKSDRGKGMLKEEIEVAINQNKNVIPVLTGNADFNDIPGQIRNRQAVAPNDDPHAYRQLLLALGKDPWEDELESLTAWQRIRRYLANE